MEWTADSEEPTVIKVNLQSPGNPISYYSVKWAFCEKYGHGGSIYNLVVNNNIMEYDYTTKAHHSYTDYYIWQCIPTLEDGTIEISSSRWSFIEITKSTDGCDSCTGAECSYPDGLCSSTLVDIDSSTLDYNLANFVETDGQCYCPLNVVDETCSEGDACIDMDCNGVWGECTRGQCVCFGGHEGTNCEIAPDPCDLNGCEFCQPALCGTDWCTEANCGEHGTCDEDDPRMCRCLLDYLGDKCDIPPVYGCILPGAENHDACDILLLAENTPLTPTGWDRPGSELNLDGVGLVGSWYAALSVQFDFGTAMALTLITTDSNKGFTMEYSADGFLWTLVDYTFPATGNSIGSFSDYTIPDPPTVQYARLNWTSTGGSDGLHAQFRGCEDLTAVPNTDDGSCILPSRPARDLETLKVVTLSLDAPIAGFVGSTGCSPPQTMYTVAHKTDANLVYLAWTQDLPWGTDQSEGAVHISKVHMSDLLNGVSEVVSDTKFDGYVRNGGIDITQSGKVGMIGAKFSREWFDIAPWYKKGYHCPAATQERWYGGSCESYDEYDSAAWAWYGNNPLAVVVLELDGTSMEPVGTPFLLGENHINEDDGEPYLRHVYGPTKMQGAAGSGWLIYDDIASTWTGIYGSSWEGHSASTMFTRADDASADSSDWGLSTCDIEGVNLRPQVSPTRNWNFCGGHESRVVSRYHPVTGTIGTLCQNENSAYNFKVDDGDREPVAEYGSYGGGVRPCADDDGNAWIIAYANANNRPACQRLVDNGADRVTPGEEVVLVDEEIDNHFVKVATLLGSEYEAYCGLFLFGWKTAAGAWKLAEVDGSCRLISDILDVTNYTMWDKDAPWSTTIDGKVTWASAWDEDEHGHPLRDCPYGGKPAKGRADWNGDLGYDGYDFTTGYFSNQARISIYSPSVTEEELDDINDQLNTGAGSSSLVLFSSLLFAWQF
jgi:hypothetical protein